MRLDSDQSSYRSGQVIRIGVTITNVSPKTYAALFMPSFALSSLAVVDGQRRLMQPSGNRGGAIVGYGDITVFSPGKSMAAVDPQNGDTSSTPWTDIKKWGYDLSHPGDYAITGSLSMSFYELNDNLKSAGPGFLTSPEDRSNTIHIRVAE
jgi:hypothetical protein